MSDIDAARLETGRLIYDEGRRLRDLQDRRVDEIRQRSITVLSLVSAAVVVVAGVSDKHHIASGWIYLASVFVGLMVLSGVIVHVPRGGYREGPNVQQLAERQYAEAHPAHQVMRDLGWYHYDHYRANNRGVLRSINRAFTMELVFAAFAVAAVLVGAAL